jgi:hypothetical protein
LTADSLFVDKSEVRRRICRYTIPIALAAAACAGTTGPRTVENPDPSVKIPLIEKAVKNSDHSVVPQLVHDLRDDDPAVRMFSIDALHQLTGQTFDYNYYQDDAARLPAELRWEQWLAAGNR